LRSFKNCCDNARPVGAAEGCDLLILIVKKDQKIAAFGSSYLSAIATPYLRMNR